LPTREAGGLIAWIGLGARGTSGATVAADLFKRGICEIVASKLAVGGGEAGVGGWSPDAVPDVALVHLDGFGEVAVPLVEPRELEAGRRFGQRLGGWVAQHVEMMLFFGLVADEGRPSKHGASRVTLPCAARS
jgi:hypothetical protein